MVKRLIAIPLVIIFTIAAFTSVYAADLPQNVVDLPFEVVYTSSLFQQNFPYSFTSGNSYYLLLRNTDAIFNSVTQKFIFNIPENTFYSFYILIRDTSFNSNLYTISNNLLPYRFSSKDYSDSVQLLQVQFDVADSSLTFHDDDMYERKGVQFLYFKDVPAGQYSFIENRNYYSSVVGLFVDQVYVAPTPDPEPVPPSAFFSDLGLIVKSSLSWVSSSVDTITSYPFLLLTVGIFVLGAAVSFIGRLLSRD